MKKRTKYYRLARVLINFHLLGAHEPGTWPDCPYCWGQLRAC